MNTQNLEELCERQKGAVSLFLLDSCVSHSQCAPWGERNDLDAVLAWLHDLGLLIL